VKQKIIILSIGAGLCILLGVKIGWEIHRPVKCPECPEIVSASIVERDSIVEKATITHTMPVVTIMPTTRQVSTYLRDTAGTVRETVKEMRCWTARSVERDSAIIGVSICSRALSATPPADLETTIDYTPSPRIRIVERTNNLSAVCPDPPKPKRWGLTVGPYAGVGVDIRGVPQAQVGIGLSWGYRIKAR